MTTLPLPPLSSKEPGAKGPLDGLVVADFSRVLAGPYASMLLADLGAEVIKVESKDGDDTRRWVPPVRDGVSTYYLTVNRNKRSVALDFKDSEDLKLAKELASRADIMLENFKPGGLERFGLDYPSIKKANPSIIYGSITGFGPDAPGMPGLDLIVQGMSGMMSLTGDADGRPMRSGVALFDIMTGMHALTGMLAALHHRHLTGEGQHIQVSLMASALSGMVNQVGAYVIGDTVPHRHGNAHVSLFPYEPLPTADGELIVAITNDGLFRKLVNVIGTPDLADDPRFAKQVDRNKNRGELEPLLVEAMKKRTSEEWFGDLLAVGVPCGPIEDVAGGVRHAERLGLKPVVQVGEGAAAIPMVRNPMTFSTTPPRYDSPPPAVDQHGDEVREWLRQK